MSISNILRAKVKSLPSNPGVYRFLDESAKVLYVGKAINLKNRVASYFTDKHKDRPWIGVMMGLVVDVETIVVENELEALLLEASLIKEFEPKFNIKLTDDKSYPFIQLNLNEPYPRFSVTRKRSAQLRVQYFGPYLSARSARLTLEFLRNLYGIHLSPKPLKHSSKPCFYCQLSGNNCVLADECSLEQYLESVEKAAMFLRGKRRGLVTELKERMERSSANHHFEVAARLRDRLLALEQTQQQQQVVGSIDDYDAISCWIIFDSAMIVINSIREGRIVGQKDYSFQSTENVSQSELIRQFLVGYYRTISNIPKKIYLEVEINDLAAIEKLLSDSAEQKVTVQTAKQGEKLRMIELASKNARLKLEMSLMKRGDNLVELVALQKLLSSKIFPERIEAVDISNLGSSEAVGACVCFINGIPDKSQYRRYKIKTVAGQNDFAMIREVVERRLHDTSRPAPDLLIIDGGKQQLAFAMTAVTNSPVKPRIIIGLAKKPDRVFLAGKKMPLATPRGHKGLRLLSRVRDEVHRFGISYQRSRQRKRSLEN